jgi:hypothetical protein
MYIRLSSLLLYWSFLPSYILSFPFLALPLSSTATPPFLEKIEPKPPPLRTLPPPHLFLVYGQQVYA